MLEGTPGADAVCQECGFQATVREDARQGSSPVSAPAERSHQAPSDGGRLLSAIAFLFSLAGAVTFYLAQFYFPAALSVLGIVAGLVARQRGDPRGTAAAVLGAVGLVLFLAALLLS